MEKPQSSYTDEVRTSLEESNPLGPVTATPFPVSNAQVQTDKKEREAKTGFFDYLNAMWREDSPVDGIMARLAVEKNLLPDPNYVPYAPDEWKSLTAGIPEEYHSEFYKAHSAAHAQFLRERLLQKVDNLQHLSDMGVAGNIGRFAFGFVEPTNLLAAVAGGPILAGVNGVRRSVRAASNVARLARGVDEAAVAADNIAAAAAHEGSTAAVATNIAGAGAVGAGFEAVRQDVNHEDSPAGILEAALFTMGLAAPFAGLSARQMNRFTAVAASDAQALRVAQKAIKGDALNEAEQQTLKAAEARLKKVYDVETGKVDAAAQEPSVVFVDKKGNATVGSNAERTLYVDSKGNVSGERPAYTAHETYVESDSEFVAGLRRQFREQADKVRSEMFPPEDRSAPHSPNETERAMAEARLSRENEMWASRQRIAAEAGRPVEPAFTPHPDRPLEGPMQAAIRKAADEGRAADAKSLQAEFDTAMQHMEAKSKAESARKRTSDYDAALREVEAQKAKELNDLWASGHISKAEADEAMAELTRERGAAAIPEKREAARAERDVPNEGADKPVEGTEVILRDDSGRADSGVVVGVNQKGTLKVDMYPEMSPSFKPASGARYKWVKREDLDPDSALYRDPGELEGTFLHGSVGSAQGAPIANDPGQGSTAFAKARLDIFAQLNKSSNSVIRQFAQWMIKDAIQTDKYVAQGWTASERKSHISRVLAGEFHRTARDAWHEVVKVRGISKWKQIDAHREFYENVSRVTRGDTDVLAANPDIAAQLKKASAAQTKVYDELATRALNAGVKGAENILLSGNAAYVNRVWNHNNIRAALKEFSPTTVHQLLAAAFRGSWRGDAEKAKVFLNVIREHEFTHVLQDLQMLGGDLHTLRSELKAAGMSDAKIDLITETMFDVKESGKEVDAGNAANLKFRFDIDENASLTQNGKTLRVADLFENDARVLVDKYVNSIGGHISVAETGGYKSRSDFMRALADSDAEHLKGDSLTTDAAAFNREKQTVMDMYNAITGRPMSTQSYNRIDRVLNAFRAYTRSAMLGQLGIAAATEMSNAIGLGTFQAFMQQSPAFAHLIRSFRTGRIAKPELARDIEAMVGSGHELAAAYARQHEVSEFTYDRGVTMFEDFANKSAHAVDVLSGNRNITAATRQMAAAIMVQKHVNMATGKMKLTPKLRERLVGQGIDDDMIDDVLAHLDTFSKKDARGIVDEIDWEGWQQQHPKTYDTYQLALMREVRDAIQDHDIGETAHFMHTTLGKIASELRTFLFVSHAKQNLKNLHYRDLQALTTFSFTFAAQVMATASQTAINFAQNPQERDRRLSPESLVWSSLQRMSIMGLTPAIFGTTWAAATGQPFLQVGSTANTDNRNLLLTPSMTMAQRLIGGLGTGAQAFNPFASTTTTQKEARDLFGALPGSNLWLMRNLNDSISSSFPKNEPRESRQ